MEADVEIQIVEVHKDQIYVARIRGKYKKKTKGKLK